MSEFNLKVSVVMITYRHENFIKEAINGVILQEIDYPMELIIADDNSMDNTELVVKSIININPLINIKYTKHKKNKGINDNFTWAISQAKGEYIAICEGDDYWSDQYKIDKQVKFLENNKNLSMICTDKDIFFDKDQRMIRSGKKYKEKYEIFSFEYILSNSPISTLTVLFRRDLLIKYFSFYNDIGKKPPMYDYCLWLYFSLHTDVVLLNECTAVYRVCEVSATHDTFINFEKKWSVKKQYWNTFQDIKNNIEGLNPSLMNKSEYDRAKGFYVMATLAGDYLEQKKMLNIYLKNGNVVRFAIMSLVKRNRIALKSIYFVETKFQAFLAKLKKLRF
jgi:glycosyltransferase involved in cell wall biosynthesis